MNINDVNAKLEYLYSRIEQHPRGQHIDRIYFHAGYTVEELVASLRGIVMNMTDILAGFQEEIDEINKNLEVYVDLKLDEMVPEIIDKLNNWVGIALHDGDGIQILNQAIRGNEITIGMVKQNATPLATFNGRRNAIIQQIMVDSINQHYYTIQTDGHDPEGYLITRLRANGEKIDDMWIKGAGHGNSSFLIPNNGAMPYIVFVSDAKNAPGVWRYARYTPHTTVEDANSYPVSFEDPKAYYAQYDYRDGWLAGVSISQHVAGFAPAVYNGDGTFTVDWTKRIEKDIADYIDYNLRVEQGVALIKGGDITGDYSDKVMNANDNVLALLTGPYMGNAHITLIRHELATNSVTVVSDIEHVEHPAIPYGDATGLQWNGDWEPEGIVSLKMDQPTVNQKVSGGIAWAISTGSVGYRRTYLFAFLSQRNQLLRTATSLASEPGDIMWYPSQTTKETHLSQLDRPGDWYLNGTDIQRMVDAPDLLKWYGTNDEWILSNSNRTYSGEVIQRLYHVGITSGNLTFERFVNYQGDEWGANWTPKPTPWVVLGTGHYNHIDTSHFKSLAQVILPGLAIQIGGTELQTLDPELFSLTGNRAGYVSTPSDGGIQGGDGSRTIIQTYTVQVETTRPLSLQRSITYKYVNGGGVTEIVSTSPWIVTSGRTPWADLVPAEGTTVNTLSGAMTSEGAVIRGFNIKGITGTGSTAGLITTLPANLRPINTNWGIPIVTDTGKNATITVNEAGAMYVSSGTLTADDSFNFNVKIFI